METKASSSSQYAHVYVKRHTSSPRQTVAARQSKEKTSESQLKDNSDRPQVRPAPCVDPADPIFLGLTLAVWTVWAFFVLSSSYSIENWNRLGDSCLGCWRNEKWTDIILSVLVAAWLGLHIGLFRAQNLSFGKIHQLGTSLSGILPSCSSSVPKKTACTQSSYARKNWMVLVLAVTFCFHLLIETSNFLRMHNIIGLRPCAYKLRRFPREQQEALRLDPARIFLVSHLTSAKDETGKARQESVRAYAVRHGYSFITTEELFGTYDYNLWLNQTTLRSRAQTWRNSRSIQDHSQVVSIYHVLFEAALQPIPEWVVWMDERIEIADRAVSLESVMFGLCSRVLQSGEQDFDHQSALWCKYEPQWSAQTHQEAMESISSLQVPQNVIENTPDVVAVGVGSGEIHKFSTELLFLKNSDWVRDSLFNIFFNSNSGMSDGATFNAFLNFQSKPDKVKVLPGCFGVLGRSDTMGPSRFHYGDFARISD